MKLGDHWRTVKYITAKLQFPSEDACRHWLHRHRTQIGSIRRGRIILVDEHEVDRVLRDSNAPSRKTEAA